MLYCLAKSRSRDRVKSFYCQKDWIYHYSHIFLEILELSALFALISFLYSLFNYVYNNIDLQLVIVNEDTKVTEVKQMTHTVLCICKIPTASSTDVHQPMLPF